MLIIWLIIVQSLFKKSISSQMQGEVFKTINIQQLNFRGLNAYIIDGRKFWTKNMSEILTYEETCKPTVVAQFQNGILGAFLLAYNRHGDVKITPDDIWITIVIYFSKYVNDNSENLKTAFVQHEGKKKLTVTTQNQLSQSEWNEFFDLMITQIRKNTLQGVTQKLQSDFSTTGRLQKIISTATIMSVFKRYFDYEREIPDCGIQNMHFGGTLEDWQKILKKLKDLAIYDINNVLKIYIEKVSDILQKFIQTYQGNVDLKFWNSIINQQLGELGSGQTSQFSGWLINLFGYFQKTQQVKMDTIGFDIQIDNKITGVVKTVRFVGGFRGLSIEGRIIRPHLSIAILDSQNKEQYQSEQI